MRNAIILAILLSVITITVFGFLGMGGHNSCIVATFKGMPACPNSGAEAGGDALFHIEVFKSFSQAVSTAAVVLLILSVIIVAMVRLAQPHLPARTAYSPGTVQLEEIHLRSCQRMRRWLTLHEKRDPAAVLVGA